MNEHSAEQQYNELPSIAPPSPPSAAFVEKFLHHQEDDVGGVVASSGEFELGLFTIDSVHDEQVEYVGAAAVAQHESNANHPSEESETNINNNKRSSNEWTGSLPLYTTSVDIDYAEATIAAPLTLEEGTILRVDMGLRRILVVETPHGGVKSGETFKVPYRIHHTPMSELEAFRHEAYNNGHYHGWVSKLFGCCEKGSKWSSCLGAVCCPCFLLSTIMNKTHLNCCGKHISSVSPRTRQKRQRCTKICVITLYVTAFALTILLILHIAQAIYCLEVGQLFSNGNNVEEAAVMREEEVEEIEINSLMDGEGATFCSYRINTAYLSSILILDVFLWGYILLLMSRARAAIREHHYIYGGPLEDCCVSCCCNCCTLTQLAKETSYEDHETRRLSNVDVAIGEPGEFLSESGREGQHCYRPIV